ncbi:MAG: MarR family transcriptional regulator, partial [Halalkalicoccus sp.]
SKRYDSVFAPAVPVSSDTGPDMTAGIRVVVILGVVLVSLAGVGGAVPLADDPNAGSGATTADGDAPGVHGATVTGDGYIADQERVVQDHPGPPYVWSTEPLTLTATIGGEAVDEERTLCAEAIDVDGESLADLGCETVTLAGGERDVEFEIEGWPEGYEGDVWVTVELFEEEQSTHYETVPVTVIHPEGDLSGDRLTNEEEVRYRTDFTVPDTTGNGLTDWEEINVHGSDPLATDTSGDGVSDATAVRLGLDPTIPYLPYLYVGGGLLLVVVVVAGGGALGWQFMRRYGSEEPATNTSSGGSNPAVGSAPTPDRASPADDPPAPSAGGPPLTKEEEICRLLRQHGHRMKQSQLVERTEWSQATVSRLISKLEDEGTVTKLRSGRENIVELREGATDTEPNDVTR